MSRRRTILTPAQRAEIFERYSDGEDSKVLAQEFGLTKPSSITDICRKIRGVPKYMEDLKKEFKRDIAELRERQRTIEQSLASIVQLIQNRRTL